MTDTLNTHKSTFVVGDGSVTTEFTNRYIAEAQKLADDLSLKSIRLWAHRENNQTAIIFTADTLLEFHYMKVALYGDGPSPNAYLCEQTLEGEEPYQKKWLAAAQELLAANKISFGYKRLNDTEHRFVFHRPSHASFFMAACEHGIINNATLPERPETETVITLSMFQLIPGGKAQ